MKTITYYNFLKILTITFLLILIGDNAFSQSFILNLQANPMSFTNAQRTIIVNTGNSGTNQGSVHKYSNVITKDGITVYALMTILEQNNATITNFDDDAITGEMHRFQPRIGTGNGGGNIVYQLEFFNTADNQPVFVYNYYMTAVDIDGNSSSNREFIEIGGYTNYQVNNPTQLVISTNNTTGRTRFLGRITNLDGVTFDNTCSFISRYLNPNNKITFVLGQSGANSERFYSVQFGVAGGAFSNPIVVNNPLPVAVDDNGIPVSSLTGGTAVANVLDNDLYDGSPVVPSAVNISLVTPASHPGIVLNTSTGAVTVNPGTPAGSYTLVYQICMLAAPSSCDIATVFVNVVSSDLSITKTAMPDQVIAGQGVVYTVTVTNNGPSQAQNVVAQDLLSPNLNLTSVDPSVGTWSAPNWNIGNLDNGESVTLSLIVTAIDGFTGIIENTATVISSTYDPVPENNSASVSITVNPSLPLINLYPALGFGTLGFEDLWPGKGDYDFNDLVIDYQFEITSTPSNMVDNVKATFVIKAFGAELHNGFGFQFMGNINPQDLTVTGSRITENYITLSGNGTEAGQIKPTFILFDDAFKQMAYPGSGTGVNTEHPAPYVTPVTLVMNITFKPNTYSYNDLDIANFNPFIMVNLNRGLEVHLPDYPPTSLADQSIFGQADDTSDPALERYYKTENNLPWAINIYESFAYPIERVNIPAAYNHFIEWAVSGGQSYPDWFQNKPGYRNTQYIY